MSDLITNTPDAVAQQRDAFIENFLRDVTGVFNVFTIYIGDRLGFYRALAEAGSCSAPELAARTVTQERYVREWLEQQTLARILSVQEDTLDAASRRYYLPPGHAEALIDCSSLNYIAPMAQLIAGVVKPLPALLDAFRQGGGVPFSAYGKDMREGQAALNYPAFAQQLTRDWLPVLKDVHARLQADPPARVADIGCGFGWSSIGMAVGYPNIQVDGFDLDGPSIEKARENARLNQVSERVQFQARDIADPALAGKYDLVTAFECVHDFSDPVGMLARMRQLAAAGGAVFIADERVGDRFTAQGSEEEARMYGWSVLHCLPAGMADPPAVGTGTVMRPATLRSYALQAGFRDLEILPIDDMIFRFYRLIV